MGDVHTHDPAPQSPPPESLVAAHLDPADRALAAALGDDHHAGATLTREQLAERAGLPLSLIEAMEREGLLSGSVEPADDDVPRYGEEDVGVLAAGMELLQAGLPLAELLDLARRHDQAMRVVADEAVELFVRFVRDPIVGSVEDPLEASQRMLDAFQGMLPATSSLVTHHFRRTLLRAARERLQASEADGLADRE